MRNQLEGECFDDYVMELKILSTNFSFCNTCFPGLLRDRIVGGIENDWIRKQLLAEKELTIDKTMEICKSYEVANEGMNTLKKIQIKEKENRY